MRAQGRTLAGTHVPVLVEEILAALRPGAGDIVVDCTKGYGGHAGEFLRRIGPTGRLIGLDVDALQLQRTEQRPAGRPTTGQAGQACQTLPGSAFIDPISEESGKCSPGNSLKVATSSLPTYAETASRSRRLSMTLVTYLKTSMARKAATPTEANANQM